MELKTERLLLRSFVKTDACSVSYNSRRPAVAKEMPDMVLRDEAAGLEWINWINGLNNDLEPWQVLAIVRKTDLVCIGIVGVIPQKKINGEIEILYSIADEYQQNGYATEAAGALVDWFFETRSHRYICAIVKMNNIASQKVIEKLGFEFIQNREINYDNVPTMFKYYRLTELDYLKQKEKQQDKE